MDFVAVDVETANADCASICQIGVAVFARGSVVDTWESLVDPEDYFDPFNTSIHGLDATDVHGSPTVPEIFDGLTKLLEEQVVAHHMPFDKLALTRAAGRYGLEPIRASWLDTARVVRRAWPEFAARGYGLKHMAHHLEVELDHHDAMSDALACGRILCRAIEQTELSVDEWLLRAHKPIGGISRAGDPTGPLCGENLVFTGTLTLPRRRASEMAAKVGCEVSNSVTKKTSILVVGIQDLRKTRGRQRSRKHQKADQLVRKGQMISIISEEDFIEIVSANDPPT